MSISQIQLKNTGKTVAKSKLDERNYEFFTLPNDLDVLIVSDKQADTASACLGVNVGSLSDPVEALGALHFLEHLLFMGTAKYPNESDYSNYISSHGGYSNAYTAATETVYYFQIDSGHLEPALDRFSQFFIAPLFDPSSTDRELNAVHSEHDKNVYNDSWRQHELLRAVVNPEHPISRFHTGNIETLREIPLEHNTDVRKLVLQCHKDFYSSNLMKLCVVGKESLDELREMVVTKFAAVPNENKTTPEFSTDILRDNKHVLECCPVKQKRSVSLQFVLPSDYKFTETSPVNVISHCLGDEGPKSLFSLLKAYRYADALSSGRSRRLVCGSTFGLDISLTELGLVNLADVLRLSFAYINSIKTKSDQEWERLCKEAQKIDYNTFNFVRENPSPCDLAVATVENMFLFEPEKLIQAQNIYHRIDIDDIRAFLDAFDLDHSFVVISSGDSTRDIPILSDGFLTKKPSYTQYCVENKKVAEFENEETSCEELNKLYKTKEWAYDRFYKNRYAKYPLTADIIDFISSGLTETDLQIAHKNEPASYNECKTSQELLDLPCTNPFIPDSFDLLTKVDVDAAEPSLFDKVKTSKSTYTHHSQVKDLPLTLAQSNEKYTNSIPNLRHYSGSCTHPVHVQPPSSIAEFKKTVSKLVQDNLIGFDLEHFNTGLGPHAVSSNKDDLTPEIVEKIFGRTDSLFGNSLPKRSIDAESKPVAKTDDAKDGDDEEEEEEVKEPPEGDCSGDEADHEGDEDGEDNEDNEDGEEAEDPGGGKSGKLFTVDTFFSDKDEKIISQFIPPALLSIPIPNKHFTITNTRASTVPVISAPIVPPVSCFYKFTDSYKSANVEIRSRIELPGISKAFLALYTRAFLQLVAEQLYPATLLDVTYRITEAHQALDISVSGNRQAAAETYLTIIQNVLNPLLSTEEFLQLQYDKCLRQYISSSLTQAYQQVQTHMPSLTQRNGLHISQLTAELIEMGTNLADYSTNNKDYFRSKITTATVVIIGNVTQSYAVRLAQDTVITLDLTESLLDSLNPLQPVMFPTGCDIIGLLPNGNAKDNQNALFNYYYSLAPFRTEFVRTQNLYKLKQRGLYQSPIVTNDDDDDHHHISGLDLNRIENGSIFNQMSFYGNVLYNYFLSHIMSDHAFDCLRTKQQLGYIVSSQNYYSMAQYGLVVIVQSGSDTYEVDNRIEYYMRKEFKEYLSAVAVTDHDRFVSNLSGAQSGLLERFTNLGSEANFFVGPILGKSYDYYRPLVLGLLLPYVHRHVLLGFYNHWFCDLAQRRKFACHVYKQQEGFAEAAIEKYNETLDQDVYTDINQLIGLKSLFPSASL